MKHLDAYEKSPLKNADAVFAVMRGILAIILLWKAVEFYMDRELLLRIVDEAGVFWFAPVIWAHYVILAHFFGGFCLLVGAGTRFAAVMQIPILLGAIFYVHVPRLLQLDQVANIAELNLSILTLLLLTFYAIRGAGKYSIDYDTIYDEEHVDKPHYPHSHIPNLAHKKNMPHKPHNERHV